MKKVLFVDDEPNVLNALSRAQHKQPYLVLMAASPEEALDVLENDSIDVVVSDEKMPGMAGSEFLSIVAKRHPETVRIILTGHANLDSAVRAINEGEIYRFLLKPCQDSDLISAIHQALEHKELVVMSQKILKGNKQTSSLLHSLEQKYPGITQLKKDDSGTLLID